MFRSQRLKALRCNGNTYIEGFFYRVIDDKYTGNLDGKDEKQNVFEWRHPPHKNSGCSRVWNEINANKKNILYVSSYVII